MKMLKENKGITLVALIITIIILLILATVTILEINGVGIISKSRQAKVEYEKAAEEEKGMLAKLEELMENLFGTNNSDQETPGEENSGDNDSTENGDSTFGDDTGALEDENSNQGGENSESGTTTGDTRQEYVIGEIKTENSTINGGTASGTTNPIIPAGFQAKNTETSKWDAEGGPEVNKGLVITDGTSEFVWVPVTSSIASYNNGVLEPEIIDKYDNDATNLKKINDKIGTSYTNSSEFLNDLQVEFNAMAESVKKNGGFYVGRYETNITNDKKIQSAYGARPANAFNDGYWYGLYAYQKTYSTPAVQGSMIWGCQYNAMFDWMENTGVDINQPIGDNRNKSRTSTGTKETDKINNIYDIYGCHFEWTLGVTNDGLERILRGGSSKTNYRPTIFRSSFPTDYLVDYGTRLSLYIK